jgi:tetratricopeptide (TPR) repeat protein
MASNYGNLGLMHRTRGDLDKAEEFHVKSLALEEELGRKEGMGSDYGNLGSVYQRRGDLDEACRLWGLALKLFEEVGAAGHVAQTRRVMDEAGCGKPE